MTPRGSKTQGKENTFLINAFQTPNSIVDDLMWLLTPEENTALMYTIRRIIGFGKRQDRISLTQYDYGTRGGDGQPLDHGTGMGHVANQRALTGLTKYRVLRVVQKGRPDREGEAGSPTLYAIQMDSTRIDWDGLHARKEKEREANTARTAKATAARMAKRAADRGENTPETGGNNGTEGGPSTSDVPGPSTSDVPGPSTSDVLNNKQRNTGKDSVVTATPLPPVSSEKKKGRKRESQADPRSNHPAILAFWLVTGKRPKKETYDAIIERLGEQVDNDKLRAVWRAWSLAGHNPLNLGGMLDWYENGIPERGKTNGNGARPQPDNIIESVDAYGNPVRYEVAYS